MRTLRWWFADELLITTVAGYPNQIVVPDVADYLTQLELGRRVWQLWRRQGALL